MVTFLAGIISEATDIVYYMRIQNYHEGSMRFRAMLAQIQQHEELCMQLMEVLTALLNALELDDEVLFADILEDALIPACKEMLSQCEELAQTENCGNYQLEYTASGFLTVCHIPSGLYLHSNHNPMEEARFLVEKCYDASQTEYVVWGSGLGYHVLQLYEKSRGAVPIRLFEESEDLLRLAYEKGVLSQIPREILTCEIDQDGRKFAACIQQKKTGILLHLPSIKKIENESLKEVLRDFFASWNGTIQFHEELAVNYNRNILECTGFADELQNLFCGKEVLIVGGGPSLDEHIEDIKANREHFTIAAVTTVWRKLLQLGIEPDVMFVMDSQKRTFGHMNGVSDTKTPFVLDSTAYWEFAAKYAGPKYLACQKGYPAAEKLAKENNLHVFETGGSVTTLALDVALQLGARSITFVGADMAYPEGKSHASGTMDEKKRDTSDLIKVKAQDGSMTYTDKLFDMYRRWIEGKLREYPQIPAYNMAEKGAYIEGASLWKNK